ncbi:MAG: ABC transporter permease [Thermoplasmataceae archaeon]
METINMIPGANKSEKKRNPRLEDIKDTAKLLIKNKLALTGLIITSVYLFFAILDVVYPQYLGVGPGVVVSLLRFTGPNVSAAAQPTYPVFNKGWWYYLGTTYANIPLLPAMLAALYNDIWDSALVVVSGAIIGIIIGTFSGYFGKLIDELMMRITDIFFSIPFLIFAIIVVTVMNRVFAADGITMPPLTMISLALIIIWWPTYARLTRSITLSVKSQKFIEASTASGSSRLRNVVVHVIPNVLSPVFVQVSLDIGGVILLFATLAFLPLTFLGLTEFTPELGSMISSAEPFMLGPGWLAAVIPAMFLLIFTVSINLFGDGLRDVLDPKLRR